jgi:hypothetical protein
MMFCFETGTESYLLTIILLGVVGLLMKAYQLNKLWMQEEEQRFKRTPVGFITTEASNEASNSIEARMRMKK